MPPYISTGLMQLVTTGRHSSQCPETVRVYLKSHISKTMGIAVAVVSLEDSLDNGGRSIKIFFKDLKFTRLDRESLLVRMVLLLKIKETSITLIVM